MFLLCWGALLNFFGYRLLHNIPLFRWPFCEACKTPCTLYELVPCISWLLLQGKCRFCSQSISPLFPLIELVTLILGSTLFLTNTISHVYRIPYFLFFSALIITIRTDLESLLILRLTTLWLIPCGIFLSMLRLLPIAWWSSLGGCLLGYGSLWLISGIFYRLRGIKGLGEGDPELLAFIGSYIGLCGCWATLLIGSMIGSIVGIALLTTGYVTRTTYVPFGPFLAIGAILYVLYEPTIMLLMFGNLF